MAASNFVNQWLKNWLTRADDFTLWWKKLVGTAGDVVVQGTSKATTVILPNRTGQITMHNAALNAGVTVTFTVTCTVIKALDNILVNHKSGGTAGAYYAWAHTPVDDTSFQISVRNQTGGNLSEAIVLSFTAIRGAIA